MLDAKMPEAWRVLRIQSELVDGIEQLIKLNGAVTVFGGARFTPDSLYYKEAQRLGKLLAAQQIPVITGGDVLWITWDALAAGNSHTVIASPGKLSDKELRHLEGAAHKGQSQGLLLRLR